MQHPRGSSSSHCGSYDKSELHQGKKRNFEIMDAIEFLHRVCLHIPEHYEALIRYYGYYANIARGKRKKLGLEN